MARSDRVTKVTPEVAEQVRELHRAGLTQRAICERLALSHSTVWHIIWRWERRYEMLAELRLLRAQAARLEARIISLQRRLEETEV